LKLLRPFRPVVLLKVLDRKNNASAGCQEEDPRQNAEGRFRLHGSVPF
jgi:hypothetical protein